MAITLVGIGSAGNDGTGDTARTAFDKINGNFTDAENAASKLVATTAQAKAGTAGVLPDAAGTHAAIRELMVGTVSQSGGIPTGAIIESGSNTNGRYVKYADGTMICTHAAIINTVCTTTAGAAIGFFAQVFWTLPIVFSTLTHASVEGRREGYTTFTTINTKSTTDVTAFHQSNSSFTEDVDYSFYAIGRWF